jgi:hypothetical protein
MTDNLNIIRSKIVGDQQDVFWNAYATDKGPKSTLIISLAFEARSTDEVQLQKMMQACMLGPDDYHVVQLGGQEQVAWHSIRDIIQPETVILLGISPQQLGISAMLKFNEPNRFNDRILIPTLTLQDLEKQPEVKKQLWLQALKPVFVDKAFQKQQ